MRELSGRTAVVTGGGRGIGRAIALRLAAMGASLALLDLDEASLQESQALVEAVARQAGGGAPGRAIGLRCDVTDEEGVAAALSRVRAELGRVSVLINNAGILQFKLLAESSLSDWDRTMNVNLRSAFICSRAVIPDMVAMRWGKIVNVGSSAGKTGGAKNVGAYAVSKAGLMCLAKSLAIELAPYGVNVNAVAPALINTAMLDGIADLVGRIPLGRVGEPEDVANVIGFLCSEAAAFITGEVVDVNGGFLID